MLHSLEKHVAELTESGFTVLSDVFTPREVERLRGAIDEVFAREEGALAGHGTNVRFSINLTNKHAAFREAVQNPVVMDIMAALLGKKFVLGSLHTRTTYPGAAAQGLHRDWMLDRRIPFPTHINSMWMLDDFTAENGATRMVPGSHLWDGEPEPDARYEEVLATGTAGSVAVWDARLYHAGGANRSMHPRRGLTGFYCHPWAKTQEDHTRSINPALLAEATPLLIRLWGFHAQVGWEEPQRPNVLVQLPAPGVPAELPG